MFISYQGQGANGLDYYKAFNISEVTHIYANERSSGLWSIVFHINQPDTLPLELYGTWKSINQFFWSWSKKDILLWTDFTPDYATGVNQVEWDHKEAQKPSAEELYYTKKMKEQNEDN